MRFVNVAKDGAIELNWMWLPAFIGQNHLALRELEGAWKGKFLGRETTEECLAELHEFTLDWFQSKFRLRGLREYLAGIANVQEE